MKSRSILLVEDDPSLQACYARMLASMAQVYVASSYESAIALIDSKAIDFVISDIHLGSGAKKASGLDLIRYVNQSQPSVITMAISADPNIDIYRAAAKQGALYLLKKPIISEDEFKIALDVAEDRFRHRRKSCKSAGASDLNPRLQGIEDGVVLAPKMRVLGKRVAVAKKLPTVIKGETGTGKEQFARYIHRQRESIEQTKVPFVAVNCANLDSNTVVSQVFGHRKGAFTGADHTNIGYVGRADRGILFLDEIHCLDLNIQRRFLRLLGEGEYERLGDPTVRTCDLQIIVATTKDLDDLVESGAFIPDLRNRLIGVDVEFAPLRERFHELRPLITLCLKLNDVAPAHDLVAALETKCRQYYWQGNIRLLFKVLQSMIVMAELNQEPLDASKMPIFKAMLPPKRTCARESDSAGETRGTRSLKSLVESFERKILADTLTRSGSIHEAIHALDIPRSTFDAKRRKYGLF